MKLIRFIKTNIYLFTFISFTASSQEAELKNQMVEIDGKQVNVTTAIPETRIKNLPVVVFQNGGGTSLGNWNTVAREVAEFAPVFLYDRPGIGKSQMLDVPPTPEVITEHLQKLLTKLNIKPPYILVGHSWGGPLINSFSVKYPDMVGGMVFVDEMDIINVHKYDPPGPDVSKETQDILDEYNNYNDVPSGTKAELDLIFKIAEEEIDPMRFTPKINVPTAYLMGAKMLDFPPDFPEVDIDILANGLRYVTNLRMNDFMNKIKNNTEATLIVATHAGHFIHHDDPALVVEAIKRVTYPKIENQLVVAFEANGEKGMMERYDQMKSYYPKDNFNESLLNSLGYSLMRSGKMDEAVAIFKLNTKEYPEEANPYDSLGDAYMATGNIKEAESSYKKATTLADQQNHPNKELYKSKYKKIKNQKEEN